VLLGGDPLWIVVAALALDALIGDPDFLWRRISHPVAIFGIGIATLDRWLNRSAWTFTRRRIAGVAALLVLLAVVIVPGHMIEALLRTLPWGNVWIALVASVFIAQRSLYQHVARVRAAFESGGSAAARRAVAMIVGRDPESLDQAGICRAAIESSAENFSDGVVAPALWFALFGLPGLLAYKAVNTADSMIGHRGERYEAFGWAAARLDDVLNFIPARLSGLIIALAVPIAGGSIATALRVMMRDSRMHRSPNAGWPESAMAAALGLALAGPRRYGATIVDDPFLNAAGRRDAEPADIARALRVFVAACVLHTALYAALALAF
jgi:adenosylcobinamide-phosphate synthase